MIERDLADAAYFEQRTDSLRCQSGETEYCSYAENHPVDTTLSFVGGMVSIAGLDVFLFGGGAAALVDAGFYQAGFLCLKISICRRIVGAGVGLAYNESRPNGESFGRTITRTQITGRNGNSIALQGSSPTIINGIPYSGHAVDRMLENGILPIVVENTISVASPQPGNILGTLSYYDPVNNIRVIANQAGRIITVGFGLP